MVGLGTNETLLLLVVRMRGLLVVVEVRIVVSGFGFSMMTLEIDKRKKIKTIKLNTFKLKNLRKNMFSNNFQLHL